MHAVLSCFYLNKIPRRFTVNKINLSTRIIIFKQTIWKISTATPRSKRLLVGITNWIKVTDIQSKVLMGSSEDRLFADYSGECILYIR